MDQTCVPKSNTATYTFVWPISPAPHTHTHTHAHTHAHTQTHTHTHTHTYNDTQAQDSSPCVPIRQQAKAGAVKESGGKAKGGKGAPLDISNEPMWPQVSLKFQYLLHTCTCETRSV
jgi:hypothetical protein